MASTKNWIVEGMSGGDCFSGPRPRSYETYEAAEVAAKQRAAKNQTDVRIFEAVAVAKAAVPAIDIEKL